MKKTIPIDITAITAPMMRQISVIIFRTSKGSRNSAVLLHSPFVNGMFKLVHERENVIKFVPLLGIFKLVNEFENGCKFVRLL